MAEGGNTLRGKGLKSGRVVASTSAIGTLQCPMVEDVERGVQDALGRWVLRDPAPAAGPSGPAVGVGCTTACARDFEEATPRKRATDGRLKFDKQPEVEPAGIDPKSITKGGGAVVVG